MTINPSILRLISAPILALSAVTSLGVTNGRTSILTQKSDVVLCPNVEELLITGEDAEARIAQLNMVDAVFLAVAQKSSGIAERNFRRTAVRKQRNVW
ncbi:MAG: RpiR family transcriptional regulator, repressor of rpiB and als operon [Acidobacteriaceae bacterium]|jgi:DNA-binding MurR/RpiR family transcriptional regulator|nr:RpiR family transcriptional regulator, repressor of rpiB and als operon [Acidobacteriaceae bacterium]MEA3206522.1 RpiR family transcriptional regulator, repressor of rpiB and als operon [Verrucomicrobiota bacterium]